MSSSPKVLFGFHAVGVRLKTSRKSIFEVFFNAAGINATVVKVASGAAETVRYFVVTKLARTPNKLKERNIRRIGMSDDAPKTIYDVDLTGPVALILGAEGEGRRQLTRKTCDELVSIPMRGAVESLNVSVTSGVCLYETLRQRR